MSARAVPLLLPPPPCARCAVHLDLPCDGALTWPRAGRLARRRLAAVAVRFVCMCASVRPSWPSRSAGPACRPEQADRRRPRRRAAAMTNLASGRLTALSASQPASSTSSRANRSLCVIVCAPGCSADARDRDCTCTTRRQLGQLGSEPVAGRPHNDEQQLTTRVGRRWPASAQRSAIGCRRPGGARPGAYGSVATNKRSQSRLSTHVAGRPGLRAAARYRLWFAGVRIEPCRSSREAVRLVQAGPLRRRRCRSP
jgi:hypothetical protein